LETPDALSMQREGRTEEASTRAAEAGTTGTPEAAGGSSRALPVGADGRPVHSTPEGQKNFLDWSGGLPVVGGVSEYGGGPAVFQVAHGTTHGDITAFERQGSTEGYLGQGPYFSTSVEDVSANYAGEGPDLTNRIDKEAEEIGDAAYEDGFVRDEVLQEYFDEVLTPEEIADDGFTTDLADADDKVREAAWDVYGEQAIQHAARKAVKGDNEGFAMPTFVRLDNPANIANDNQFLELEQEFDEDGDPVGEPTGTLADWVDAVRSVEWTGTDVDGYVAALMEEGPEVTMKQAFELLNKYATDASGDNGELLSPGMIFSMIAEEAGLGRHSIIAADLVA